MGSIAPRPHGLDQPVAIEYGVNGRGRGSPDGMRQAAQQTLPDFACPPVRFLPLGAHDGRFD